MKTTYIKAKHGAERFFRGAPQFLELKQLADLERDFRWHCRDAIRLYRAWRQRQEKMHDLVEKHYGELRGALLRRQAQDAVHLYGIIRKDVRRSFQKYIAASLDRKF
jgi:hypothetical protein